MLNAYYQFVCYITRMSFKLIIITQNKNHMKVESKEKCSSNLIIKTINDK